MQTTTTPKISTVELRDISTLKLWDKNPRSIKTERFNELKNRLQRQGQIKPLLITEDGTVIGGNMRLRAMKEMGYTEVLVAVQDAETDQEIFDLALTDNEEFGYYEPEALAELAMDTGLELTNYQVHLSNPQSLDLVVGKLGPQETEDTSKAGDDCRHCQLHCGEEY